MTERVSFLKLIYLKKLSYQDIYLFLFLNKKEPKNQDLHKTLENVCRTLSHAYQAVTLMFLSKNA